MTDVLPGGCSTTPSSRCHADPLARVPSDTTDVAVVAPFAERSLEVTHLGKSGIEHADNGLFGQLRRSVGREVDACLSRFR